jgi:transposase-like protein
MNRQRRKHSAEFKQEAVALALVTEHGYSYADAGRSLEVNANLIASWKQEF